MMSIDIQQEFEKMEKLFLEEKYEECKKLSEELLEVVDNDFDRVELLHAIGDCLKKLGEERSSIPVFKKALDLARKVNFFDEMIHILTKLASINFRVLDNTEKAIEYLTECIEKSKEYSDPYYIESSLSMLARIYYNSSNYSKSLDLLKEALMYLDTENKDYLEEYFEINCLMGTCYLALGNLDEFENYYLRAFESIGNSNHLKDEEISKLSNVFNHSYVFYTTSQDHRNDSMLSNIINTLFPEKYKDILYLFACQEDSYKEDTIPTLFDIIDGKYPLEAKKSAIKAISYILGSMDNYHINILKRKYHKYMLFGIIYKKAAELSEQMRSTIEYIRNK